MQRRILMAAPLVLTAASVLSCWELSADNTLRFECEESDRLSAEFAKRAREKDVLNALALGAAAGNLPLADAADAALSLLRGRHEFRINCDVHWAGATARQGAARHLIVRLEWLLATAPEAHADASARLEAEYWVMDPGPGW